MKLPELVRDKLVEHSLYFERQFKIFFDELQTKYEFPESSKANPEVLRLIKDLSLRGGKRSRVAFIYETARLFDNDFKIDRALSLALSVELLQTHLLIHDDIIDNSPTRRGGPTTYMELLRTMTERDALATAIMAGDIVAYLAITVINDDKSLESSLRTQLIQVQLDAGLETFKGQIFDMERDNRSKFDDKRLERLADYKAVRSSTWAPMRIGQLLSGNENHQLTDSLRSYALAVGIAHQYQDDYLGIFGDEKKTGKSSSSDIVEGKRTVLVHHVLQNGSEKEKQKLSSLLGSSSVTEEDMNWIRGVMISNGSVEHLRQRLTKHAKLALEETEKWSKLSTDSVNFFRGIADWAQNRSV